MSEPIPSPLKNYLRPRFVHDLILENQALHQFFKDFRNTLLMNESLKVDKVVDGLITNNRHVSTAHNPTYHSQFRFVSVEHKIIQESHRRDIKIELLL